MNRKINLGLLHEKLTDYLRQYTTCNINMSRKEVEEKFIKKAEVEDE